MSHRNADDAPRNGRQATLAAAVLAALASVVPALARAAPPATAPPPRTSELWPGGAPGARGGEREDRPAVTAYLPAKDVATGAGILVLPGGGFTRRCEDHEGVLAAEWLRDHGVAAFLLRYRVLPMGTVRDAVEDVHRGLRHVRAHAAELGVSPRRLGALGFSAGAPLVASIGLQPRPGRPDAADPLERVSSRPDFIVLAYGDANQTTPGLRGLSAHGLSAEEAAATLAPSAADLAQAPPAFLFGTAEDAGAARRMTDLYGRLLAAGRPAEAHFFAFGEHGTGFALGDPLLGGWPSLLLAWIRTQGLLTDQPRVALRGRVTVDGAPLPRGTVVLTPLAGTAAPVVIAYAFGTAQEPGDFALPAERGPVPGRYKVEVRQDATRWGSNSRDPVLLGLQRKVREGGALDARDVAEWRASALARDFSPSLERQRVFTRRRPGDEQDIVVEITPGEVNRLDLALRTR